MDLDLIGLFEKYKDFALLISILISIIIAILGIIPSFFVTGANIIFFGFWEGIIISATGEALGAIVSFIIYRMGIKKIPTTTLYRYPKLIKLMKLEGRKAFFAVFSLRLMPFIPSGLITLAAAFGRISIFLFALSSSLGKIPALLIEGYSVYQVTSFSWQGKLILFAIGAVIIFWNFKSSST